MSSVSLNKEEKRQTTECVCACDYVYLKSLFDYKDMLG